MEKTIPRQFFDRIYGCDSAAEDTSSSTREGGGHHHHTSFELDKNSSPHFSIPINTSTPYINGFASFSECTASVPIDIPPPK